MKFISSAKQLPSKSEMLKDIELQRTKKVAYFIRDEQHDYMNELSTVAEIDKIPDVIFYMGIDTSKSRDREPYEFRKYKYVMIDDKTFRKEKYLD